MNTAHTSMKTKLLQETHKSWESWGTGPTMQRSGIYWQYGTALWKDGVFTASTWSCTDFKM